MKIEAEPHPLSKKLSEDGMDYTDEMVSRLYTSSIGTLYGHFVKICTFQPEIHECLLRTEIIDKLAENITHNEPPIATYTIEILQMIFVSDTHQDVISKFVGEHYEETIELIKAYASKQ